MHDFQSPLEAFLYWEANKPHNQFLIQPINGKRIIYTYQSAGQEIRKIAAVLKKYDLKHRSQVAILSKNCAHWVMADLAIMMTGHVSVPIYPTLNAKSIKTLLEHSESKAIIIGKLDDFDSQTEGIKNIHKISVALYGINEGEQWESLIKSVEPITETYTIRKDDLLTIIYTSGTTGVPKGVMHSAGNVMISAGALLATAELLKQNKFFSFLPLAHVAERVALEFGSFFHGSSMSFAESLDTFALDLENTQPDVFFAVPRIWTKFQEKILQTIPQKKLTILLRIPILNTLIRNKLKQKLGLKKATFICSGAAPLPKSLILWYKKIGVQIFQGYGMTEDCMISHFNHHAENRIGSVGKKLNGVVAKLSPEGEILIKNNCLMQGYFKAPEVTNEVFDDEGFLKTGDKGEYDHDGYLFITGRIKDQFKTDKGKYISPAPIELEILKNTDIEQICMVGTGIPQPIALVTLSLLASSKSRNDVIMSLQSTIDLVSQNLENHEKIQKIVIMKEEWNVDNGLTTPTLKLKRNSIEKIHQHMYPSWFKSEEKVIFE